MNGNWTRTLGVALAAVIVASTLGCNGAMVVAKTPQDVFDTTKGAMAKKDYGTFMQCLTVDGQDDLVGKLALAGLMMPGFAALDKGPDKEAHLAEAKKVTAVMEKHGLTEGAMKKVMEDKDVQKLDQKGKMKKLAGMVKDRAGFVGDMFAATDSGKENDETPFDTDAKLADLKVVGDSATGTFVYKVKGKEKRDPAVFKKVDGNWRIDQIGKP